MGWTEWGAEQGLCVASEQHCSSQVRGRPLSGMGFYDQTSRSEDSNSCFLKKRERIGKKGRILREYLFGVMTRVVIKDSDVTDQTWGGGILVSLTWFGTE